MAGDDPDARPGAAGGPGTDDAGVEADGPTANGSTADGSTADGLSAGAVARRLGVAVTTLRSWHRRYGLGPSQHLPGHHRRYTPADLARLEIMRRLTGQGVSPAEAAAWARRTGVVPGSPAGPRTVPGTHDGGGSGARAGSGTRDGGGATVGVGRAGPSARGLARAAMRLDATAMVDTLRQAIAARGVIATWDGLLRPVLAGIGARHAATAGLIEVEHLLSRCATEALAAVPRPGGGAPSPRILLACADEEQHTLPLEALAAALAEIGLGCRLLGPRLPSRALVDAVNRTGPAVVGLWSHTPATAAPAQLEALLGGRHRPLLVLAAGPGWSPEKLPAGVVSPADLTEAVSVVTAVMEPLVTG